MVKVGQYFFIRSWGGVFVRSWGGGVQTFRELDKEKKKKKKKKEPKKKEKKEGIKN